MRCCGTIAFVVLLACLLLTLLVGGLRVCGWALLRCVSAGFGFWLPAGCFGGVFRWCLRLVC